MKYTEILYTKERQIAKITLNRPDRMNSFSPEMSDEMTRAVADASKDKDVRVIIFTGAGRAFCAGADVKAMAKEFDQSNADDKLRKQKKFQKQDTSLNLEKRY